MNVKQKILIADDSEINRALLMEILGDGYEYLEAENGVRAVELLREHTDIALVLLDIMMPQMDGFDVLKVMRCYSWLDEIPVIMISAAKDTANIERAYDLGVADYMRRPFERVMVLRQVQNVLMLYAKQKRLTRLVTDQVYEKEHNSVLMISILSHVVEFRNSESGLHVLHIRTLTDLLLHQLAGKTDRYQLDESDISLHQHGIGPARPGQDRDPHRDPQQARPPDRRRIRDDQDPHGEGCPHPAGPEQHHRRGKRAPAAGGLCHLPLAP